MGAWPKSRLRLHWEKGTLSTLSAIAANTGQRVMQAARDAFAALAQRRGEK